MAIISTNVISKFTNSIVILIFILFWCHLKDLCLFSCKKLVSARKQMSILQSPNILVIQLKVRIHIFSCGLVVNDFSW